MASFSEIAKKKQSKAFDIEANYKKGLVDVDKVIEAYQVAGEAFENALDVNTALRSYEMARNLALKEGYTQKDELIVELDKTMKSLRGTSSVMSYEVKYGRKNLEGKFVFPILSIVFLLSALIFTSFSLTGYSIVGLTQNNFRFIGTGLFIFGLVFAFLYFKKKEKKK